MRQRLLKSRDTTSHFKRMLPDASTRWYLRQMFGVAMQKGFFSFEEPSAEQ